MAARMPQLFAGKDLRAQAHRLVARRCPGTTCQRSLPGGVLARHRATIPAPGHSVELNAVAPRPGNGRGICAAVTAAPAEVSKYRILRCRTARNAVMQATLRHCPAGP